VGDTPRFFSLSPSPPLVRPSSEAGAGAPASLDQKGETR
jgi:hypothetical protein